MRTTIEIRDEHRAALHALAARRGLRGYSSIIEEAIDWYLRHRATGEKATKVLLKRMGAWSADEAAAVRDTIAEVRTRWPKR